jgi:hypothetical protein
MEEQVTTADVLGAIGRRWYVAILGVAATAMAMLWVHAVPGLYSTQVNVVFMAPRDTAEQPRTFVNSESSVVAMAGLVESAINDRETFGSHTASEVYLPGLGVEHGSEVALPNYGGQWSYDFSRPVLSVQVVGQSPSEVRRHLDRIVVEINSTLRSLQADDGIRPDGRITTRSVPASPQVVFGNGHRALAIGVTALLGVGVTAILCVSVDRRLQSPRRRLVRVEKRGRAEVV